MRKLHLIPIIRIATRQQNSGWEKPNLDEIDGWISFLNSLNWVVKNRYVIVGNEPNHAKEWGDELSPEEYSDYLYIFSQRLKSSSSDFFILSAALDVSASSGDEQMNSLDFLKRMLAKHSDLFEKIDGLNSHSYPNPNFSGSPSDTGRGTIRTYEWELAQFEKLGVAKKLPVFITETGWAHSIDGKRNGYKNEEVISSYMNDAFDIWKNDTRIVAVTPFIFNYQEAPFDIFSWKDKNNNFYQFYYQIQKYPKQKGSPDIINSLEIKAIFLPNIIQKGEFKYGISYVKNTGQDIWERGVEYKIFDGFRIYTIIPIHPQIIEPNHSGLVYISENTLKEENLSEIVPNF